ncbi:MAG: flagellar basal body L-ring protein FlgH [Candidatus Gastranaerophilales bacterium]|nr:flagellar basal body L-ring protein FlgH [Candidatus Gastranaerophilales bacterium]
MKRGIRGLIVLTMVIATAQIAGCESLFMMNASQSYYSEPKSLYSCVRARSVGDLVTIVMNENVIVKDSLTYGSERSSNTVDNFTNFLNKILPGKIFNDQFNNFGGSNSVGSSTNNKRELAMNDSVTVQVVQMLPNGNLLVQGKKTLLNASERVDLLVSGIVDPRWINDIGQISSKNVANLQFALNGKGSTSRAGNEGVINRAVKYLF